MCMLQTLSTVTPFKQCADNAQKELKRRCIRCSFTEIIYENNFIASISIINTSPKVLFNQQKKEEVSDDDAALESG